MALWIPRFRPIFRLSPLSLRGDQRRWAYVQDVRCLATHGTQERIMLKYRNKLEIKAKQEGRKNVEELKEQYKDKINALRKQAIVPGATGPLAPPSPDSTLEDIFENEPVHKESQATANFPTDEREGSFTTPPPGVKTLSSFLDVSKVQTLPGEEIQALWRLRHTSNSSSVHFALSATTFSSLLATAKQHPSFILPVPRNIPKEDSTPGDKNAETQQAAELHYLQFAHPHINTTTLLFTSLAEFKLRGEYASPHTTITFHQELAQSHNLVLGQGTVVEERGVSVDEARWLVMCMQKFYVQSVHSKERVQLLHQFTRGDTDFKVEQLIDEAEKIL